MILKMNHFVPVLICVATFLYCCCSNAEDIVIDVDQAVPQFGQKLDEKVLGGIEKEMGSGNKALNLTKYHVVSKVIGNKKYGIYDNLLSSKAQFLLKTYLTYNPDGWLFNNYDDHHKVQKTDDNAPWINEKDPFEFSATDLCEKLIASVQHLSGENAELFPYRVFGKILRRGDATLVTSDSNVSGDYTALVFVNEYWRKNYYGELYLYDDDREMMGGASHRPGRVVIYDSSILRLNRPPAVQFVQGQVLFQVQFSKSRERMEKGRTQWQSYVKAREEAVRTWDLPDFKQPNGEPFKPSDPVQHQTLEFTTKTEKRKIVVYDNLFPKVLLDHLRDFVLKFGKYYYDDSIDEHSDNVQWIAGFDLDEFIGSPYWKVVKKVATHMTGSSSMFPYDVSINLIRSSDHTRIHNDTGYHGETEFTCLVYLNPEWKKTDYGETTFFDNDSDEPEITAQVRPRYGRTVIFDGNIPHSARPPSFNFSGARLSFATKLHRNEYSGRLKNFKEEYNHFKGKIAMLGTVNTLASHDGEEQARQLLEEIRAAKAKMSLRPDVKDDKERDEDRPSRAEDENTHRGRMEDAVGDENKDEGEAKEDKVGAEKHQGSAKEHQGGPEERQGGVEEIWEYDGEEASKDPFSLKLRKLLGGVREESPDGVAKLKKALKVLHQMNIVLHDKLREKIIAIL